MSIAIPRSSRAAWMTLHSHQPALLPPDQAGLIGMLEDWADHRLFFQCVPPVIVALHDALPPGFLDDRAAMSPALTKDGLFKAAPQAWAQARLSLDRLETQLSGKAFLLGEQFTLADAACYNPVWFLKNDAALFAEVMARPALGAWFQRIEALPDAGITAMSPAAALAVARDAQPVKLASSIRGGRPRLPARRRVRGHGGRLRPGTDSRPGHGHQRRQRRHRTAGRGTRRGRGAFPARGLSGGQTLIARPGALAQDGGEGRGAGES